MQLNYMWGDFITQVDDKTRMSLALDLVMGKHNRKSEELKVKALRTWNKKISHKESQPKRKKKKISHKESQPSLRISF
ncbi:hypothetical protein PIB30_073642 [Stylosanthes scabra]|uniref:Uncharacterized protein n=1 Tax=Stylosanthes scabra TaxID=79078 RepID=A0ABU6RPD7_9FABA|nr:hypothetical protein [Stylosanthes scabra]